MISIMMSASGATTDDNDVKKLKQLNSADNSNSTDDPRAMDAADTLVSLANTPTNEFKTTNFFKSLSPSNNNKIEIILESVSDKQDTESSKLANVESACKLLLQQVLKQCSVSNLASITIKTTDAKQETDLSHTISLKGDLAQKRSPGDLQTPSSSSTSLFNSLTTSQAKKTKKFKHITDLTELIQPDVVKTEPVINDKKQIDCSVNYLNNHMNSSDDDSECESVTSSLDTTLNRGLSNKNAYLSGVRPAPTLATGRRSKDVELPPDESKKRQERRERNKEAAARCRRKREDLAHRLTQQADALRHQNGEIKRKYQEMLNEKKHLENLLESHETQCNSNKNEYQTSISSTQQLIRIKKEDINEIIKQSSEKKLRETLSTTPNGTKFKNDKNLVLFRSQSSQLKKDILANMHLNHQFLQNGNSLFDDSTRVLTPLSATEQSWPQQKGMNEAFSPSSLNSSQSSITSSSSSSNTQQQQATSSSPSQSLAAALMQRPNNLNLKPCHLNSSSSPSQITPATSSINQTNKETNDNYQNTMQHLMQNIAFAISNNPNFNCQKSFSNTNNNNISLLMTPTIQMNTPTLLALTPLEQHFFAAAAAAAANTPLTHHHLINHHLNQFNNQQQQQQQNQDNDTNNKYIG